MPPIPAIPTIFVSFNSLWYPILSWKSLATSSSPNGYVDTSMVLVVLPLWRHFWQFPPNTSHSHFDSFWRWYQKYLRPLLVLPSIPWCLYLWPLSIFSKKKLPWSSGSIWCQRGKSFTWVVRPHINKIIYQRMYSLSLVSKGYRGKHGALPSYSFSIRVTSSLCTKISFLLADRKLP